MPRVQYHGLVGDVGGTNARFAVVDHQGHVRNPRIFPAKEYASLTDVMEMATQWFQDRLQGSEGAKARAYLRDRGLTSVTQQSFRLGYAPESRNALKEFLVSKGVGKDQIEACGLVRHGDDIAKTG